MIVEVLALYDKTTGARAGSLRILYEDDAVAPDPAPAPMVQAHSCFSVSFGVMCAFERHEGPHSYDDDPVVAAGREAHGIGRRTPQATDTKGGDVR